MANGINSKYQQYMNSSTGINPPEIQTKLNQTKQAVTSSVENNSVSQVVSGSSDPKNMQKTLLILPPIYFADKLIDKAMGGNPSKSLLGRIAGFGDKLSNVFHLDKLISKISSHNKFSDFIKNNRLTKYFTNDFKATARSSFAKKHTMVEDYSQKLISELSNAGCKITETLSTENLVSKADDFISNSAGKNTETLSILRNKLQAANLKMGESKLGNILAKGTLKTKDILTYGGGLLSLLFTAGAIMDTIKATKEAPKGEKLSTFMHVLSEQYIGILLFQPSISLLYKAGGNKYRGMTVEARNMLKNLIQTTNANTSLTKEGLKIAKIQRDLLIKGVDKDKVAELAGKGLTEVQNLAKSLKNEGAKLKFWEKPLKFLGKILNTGLDKMKIPKIAQDGSARKIHSLPGFLGGLGRFLLILMVIQPIIQKPITKLCHKIFGTPTTYLNKQKSGDKKDNNNIPNQQTPEEQTVKPQNGETNLINLYSNALKSKEIQNQPAPVQTAGMPAADLPVKPQEQNNDALPALNIKDKSKRYIPSIETNFADNEKELNDQVKGILKSTDKVIENVKKVL